MSLSNYLENAWLESLRGTAFSVATTYAKLHTGDPGETGTANPATETTRKAITWGAAASGVITQSGTLTWTSISATGSETLTHVSIWDASSGGNCIGSGAMSSSVTVNSGDTFNLTSQTFTLD